MGLENLKSVFTEGMSKFNNTDVTTMTSNYGPDGDFTQPDVFGDNIPFQQNFEELNQTQLPSMNSTLTIGGGAFTQPDAFSDNTLFRQNFEELSQTQLEGMESTLTIGGGAFTQPDAFADGHLFQHSFEELSQTQLEGMESKFSRGKNISRFNNSSFLHHMNSRLTIGGGTFTQGDAFDDGHLFQQNFEELSQTQLEGMESRRSLDGDEFIQPDVFNDGIYFQPNMYPDGESQLLTLTSQFTEGIGGLFNASTTYASSKFIPMSVLDVPSIEQILTSGNMGDLSRGIAPGSGFPLQKTSYDILNVTNNVGEDLNISGIPIRTEDGLGNLITDITKNRKFPSDTSWSNLYNPNHTSKGIGYNYGSNVNSTFSIRDEAPNITGFSRAFKGFGSPDSGTGEPYIIHNLPDGDIGGLGDFLTDGRAQNYGSRSIPIGRAITDTRRIARYLQSESGLAFMLKQNALGLFSRIDYAGEDPILGLFAKITRPQRFGTYYNPLSTLGASVSRLLGTTPNILFRRDWKLPKGLGGGTYSELSGLTKLSNTFGGDNELLGLVTGFPIAAGFKQRVYDLPGMANLRKMGMPVPKSGDKMTLASMIKGEKLDNSGLNTKTETPGVIFPDSLQATNVEEEKNGMPFYFKDLRDDTYIFFRAYIDGLTENISPSWAPTNYLGRSEPVYVYERSERDISFNLKLFAQTPDELESIYLKMNRLTSLCYPEYATDTVGGVDASQRMKPPLTKFRLGELYGTENNELTGFIKSLSYTFPSESPWETKQGYRVPKYVQAAISYQVIHMKVPSLDFVKYGTMGFSHPGSA